MSWNLLIFRPDADRANESAPLGEAESVIAKLNDTFKGLKWSDSGEAEFDTHRGFTLSLSFRAGTVANIWINGGYDHLPQLATLCKKEGWQIYDPQDDRLVELEDPYRGYG